MKKIIIVVLVLIAGYIVYTYVSHRDEVSTVDTSGQMEENAKINIDAVCEGALAYMTFTDGARADAFVAECKEGKHPEVIERYKADMNLGAGAAI